MSAPTIWSGLELRHLLALQSVAQAGSFARAAERLGYTQSAVSQQIAALEGLVGERLVERSRGQASVAMTEAGHLLLRHAEAIVARLEAARADFAAFAEGELGILRVGTYQSVSTKLLPLLMREFSVAWPRAEVRLSEAPNHDLFPLLERGELDMTFEVKPLADGPFAALEILHDPYVLLVAADSPLARRDQAPALSDIAALARVGFRVCRATRHVEDMLRGYGPEPRVIFRSDDNGAVQGMVAAGLGVALMPSLAVDERDPRVVALPFGEEVPPRVVCLVWHRDRYRSPAARSFVDMAARIGAELSQPRASNAHSIRERALQT